MNKNVIIVKYQDNFADNMSSYALAKIIEKQTGEKICYENKPTLRNNFEKNMTNFNMSYNFISSTRINEISKKAFELNKMNSKIPTKNKLIKAKKFEYNYIKYLDNEIIKDFDFKNKDFIVNFDILEQITNKNSIGLYINAQDIENNNIDYDYITRSVKRLNKYIKHPKLFIFSSANIKIQGNLMMEYEIISTEDWREEFYFAKKCKHNILLNSQHSYSLGLWAALTNQKEYYYTAYDKKLKCKNLPKNWIGI